MKRGLLTLLGKVVDRNCCLGLKEGVASDCGDVGEGLCLGVRVIGRGRGSFGGCGRSLLTVSLAGRGGSLLLRVRCGDCLALARTSSKEVLTDI